jgi:thiamine biosynthesis lipoprotein
VKNKLSFQAIGTHWEIEISENISSEVFSVLSNKIKSRIAEFDKVYSRFRDDSLVAEISKKPGIYTFPEDSARLFDAYRDIYQATGGKVTPLIGGLLDSLGYDKNYSFQKHGEIEKVPAWTDVIKFNYPNLIVDRPVKLDFGAGGKGYIIDIVGELLEKEGVTDYVIDAGGDIRFRNGGTDRKFKIGLENPNDFSEVIGYVNIENESLCASAGSRRKWAEYNHVLNPETGESARDVIATWVIATNTIQADLLATALFFIRAEDLAKRYNFRYVVLHSDGKAEYSSDFNGEVFKK